MSTFRIKAFCRDEFRLKNFLFDHPYPKTFTRFQFGYPRVYVGWRIFWALYHSAWILVTGSVAAKDPDIQFKWFIFLTKWAFFTLTMATVTDACAVVYIFVRRKDIMSGTCHVLPWYMKAAWCITTMGSVIGIGMSIAYWGLLSPSRHTVVTIETHALNAVYILLNLLVTGMPIRLLHFWYSVVYGVVYTLFTLFYYLAGGTNHYGRPYVYSVIDWREPGTTVAYCVTLGVVVTGIIHLVPFCIHCLKQLVHHNCDSCPGSGDYDDTEIPAY